MGGNVFQWNEALLGSSRGLRGGAFDLDSSFLLSSFQGASDPSGEFNDQGFRMAETPEPSSVALAALGFFGLTAWGWRRRKR
jgi:hypothetical protein